VTNTLAYHTKVYNATKRFIAERERERKSKREREREKERSRINRIVKFKMKCEDGTKRRKYDTKCLFTIDI